MMHWLQSSRTRWGLGIAVVMLAVFGIVIFMRSPSGVQLNANSPSTGTTPSPTDTASATEPGAVTGSSTAAASGASGTATSPTTSSSKATGRSSTGAATTGHPVADGASSTHWTAIVEEGASVDSVNGHTRTYVFAICGGGGGALSTIVKASTVQGPFGASGIVTTTATCPAGTILVGGGANTVPGNQSVA